MKKVILIAIGFLFSISIFAKDIKEVVVTTNPPMHCQNCENKIKKGDLRFIKGIEKIETNIPQQKVTVIYDADKTNLEAIEKAFSKTGYQIKVITDSQEDNKLTPSSVTECNDSCENEK